MGFKLTYRDGVEDDYDDNTAWAVEDGVLKMGREAGDWTVLVSPSHWATIEVQAARTPTDDDGNEKAKGDQNGNGADSKNGDEKVADKAKEDA